MQEKNYFVSHCKGLIRTFKGKVKAKAIEVMKGKVNKFGKKMLKQLNLLKLSSQLITNGCENNRNNLPQFKDIVNAVYFNESCTESTWLESKL